MDSALLLERLDTYGQLDSAEKALALQNALDAYHGDFLDGFHLSDAPRFDEWAVTTREQIRRQVIAAYHKMGDYMLAAGEVDQGMAIARRWLAVDALDETAHTLLIRLLLAVGNVAAALSHYAACADLLRAEVGIEPPAEMSRLIQQAQSKRTVTIRETATEHHNLPAAYDQFFGRVTAQQEIHSRLDQPWCRLVTLVGQGGVGKTRLATTIARSRLGHYRDGVWLVELAEVDPNDANLAEAIAIEIATALDLRLSGSKAPVAQLLDHLQHKQMLLVLDNFEPLLAGVSIVLDIIQRCEAVQLLVTSREVLRIRAEWTIVLTGLAYPAHDSEARIDDTEAIASEAVGLFAARRAQQRQEMLVADELAAIRTICRMVKGLPLAIELAAALDVQRNLSSHCGSVGRWLQCAVQRRCAMCRAAIAVWALCSRCRGAH